MPVSIKGLAVAAAVLLTAAGVAQAESYKNLAAQGYKTSKLTNGKSGSSGWILTKGTERYFCRFNVTVAMINKGTFTYFSATGRPLGPIKGTASSPGSAPLWSDLKAGRVKPDDVGSCAPQK